MHNSLVHLGCVYRLPSSIILGIPQLIRTSEYTVSIHGEASLLVECFNASKICWSTKTVRLQLLNVLYETHIGEWTQYTANHSEGDNILDLVFIHNLLNVHNRVLDNFLDSGHMMVFCLHFLLGPQTSATTT